MQLREISIGKSDETGGKRKTSRELTYDGYVARTGIPIETVPHPSDAKPSRTPTPSDPQTVGRRRSGPGTFGKRQET